jgi:peptidoglycan/xylan/chitin deacetylase (PgdA/CDA1 family)
MKIYIIKLKTIVVFAIITIALIILAAVWGISGIEPLEVFSQRREIPIYSVECKEKEASITFDCAWGADDIPQILEALETEDVKATFFVVGQWAEKNPQYVKMIADKGHDIANHSYSHLRMGVLDKDRIEEEILLCSQKLEEIAGNKVDLFRAPYGDYNNNVIRTAKKCLTPGLKCYSIISQYPNVSEPTRIMILASWSFFIFLSTVLVVLFNFSLISA